MNRVKELVHKQQQCNALGVLYLNFIWYEGFLISNVCFCWHVSFLSSAFHHLCLYRSYDSFNETCFFFTSYFFIICSSLYQKAMSFDTKLCCVSLFCHLGCPLTKKLTVLASQMFFFCFGGSACGVPVGSALLVAQCWTQGHWSCTVPSMEPRAHRWGAARQWIGCEDDTILLSLCQKVLHSTSQLLLWKQTQI